MTTRDVRAAMAARLREHYNGSANYEAGLASLSEAEREALVVSNHLIVRRALLNGPDYCATCWYRQIHCVCKYIPKIECPFRFLIYMHCKEYGRFSNTGKLLLAALPNSELFIAAHPPDEARLRAELDRSRGRCAVLFPSANALKASEWLAQAKQDTPAPADGTGATKEQVPLTIVIVDGTWGQARRMGLRLPPDLPRLVITPDAPTLNVVRQQSRHDRICTLEATAVLIKDLDPASDVPDKLLDMLQSVVREELTVVAVDRRGQMTGKASIHPESFQDRRLRSAPSGSDTD